MNKQTTKTIKSLIKIQRKAIEKRGKISPGILLVTEDARYYFISLYNTVTNQEIPLNEVLVNFVIPNLQQMGPRNILEYYITFTAPHITFNKEMQEDDIKETDAIHTKMVIMHGSHDGETIRQFWMPFLEEDRGARIFNDRRSTVTSTLEPYIIADPGIYRGDLLANPKHAQTEWLNNIYNNNT